MSLLALAEVLVKVLGYTLILYGIWMLVGQYVIGNAFLYIQQDIQRKRYVKRLNRIGELGTEQNEASTNMFHEHIEKLISAVKSKDTGEKKKNSVINFYILSLFLFAVSFMILLLLLQDFILAMVFGLVFMSVPYLILRMRLINKRMKTSLAFMDNFHIIVQSYSTNSKSAYHMVQDITENLDDKQLKSTFIKLLASMQQDRKEKDFRNAIIVFAYSINSSFAIRFGNLLSKAHLSASDITLPLNDLSDDVTARRNDLDNEKSLNVETKVLGYLPIITMPIFLFAAWRVSTMYGFWTLFNNTSNLIIFLIAVVFTGISLFSVIVLTRPRSDI